MPTNVGLLQQIVPLAVLILVPVFALGLFSFVRPRIRNFLMALGALLPWNWGYSHEKEGVHDRKKRVRTRAEQLAEGNMGTKENIPDGDARAHAEDALFPGLVNMSGTHCFMNSTLQALASLSTLPPYLLSIRTRAEALDVPTPVVDALIDLLAALNTPDPSGRPLRATALVEALCTPPPSLGSSSTASPVTALTAFWDARASNSTTPHSARAAALLASHEHQDAQELFQLLSECVREENARVGREGARDRGFAGVTAAAAPADDDALAGVPSPFDGLTATRRACLRCGYTAAIRHFAFDTVQLALESTGGGWGGTSLNALLGAYTTLEVLNDCPCRRCELRATARRLREDIERLSAPCAPSMALSNGHAHANGDVASDDDEEEKPDKHRRKKAKAAGGESQAPAPTPSRLRRLKAVRRMEARVLRALDAGRIEEEELEGEWDWTHGADASALRGTGDALKGVRIERVSGGVCTRQSMLGRPPAVLALHLNRSVHTAFRVAKNGARVAFPELLDLAPYTTDGVLSLDPTAALSGAAGADGAGACLYRLAAAVCHYGQHAFGHYICYRRAPVPVPVPTPASSPAYAPAPPTPAHEDTGAGWLRISDARVDRCGVAQVLAEGSAVFMLYYERVPPPPVYAGGGVADSAETLRPAHVVGPGPGTGVGIALGGGARAKARVVRSVSLGVGAGRGASASASSLSLRSAVSVSPGPEPEPAAEAAPGTPRARAADASPCAGVDAQATVAGLTLDTAAAEAAGGEGAGADGAAAAADSASLPTPPPTPMSMPGRGKSKKKKKKGNQAARAA